MCTYPSEGHFRSTTADFQDWLKLKSLNCNKLTSINK